MNYSLHHKALLIKRDELKAALASREGIQIEEKLPDHLDEALASSARTLAVDDVNRKNQLLKEVQYALCRLGTVGDHLPYGLCESCEEEIPDNRLKSVPWARLCIVCQVELEQQQVPDNLTVRRLTTERFGRDRERNVFPTPTERRFK